MTERDCEILFYAFRYCLGRMSYAVQDFCEYAKAHLQEISEKYLYLMDKEIDEAGAMQGDSLRKSGLGMACDEVDWRFLQARIKDELQRRKKKPEEKQVRPKKPKCKYLKVLQGYYEGSWEDLVEAEIKNKQEMKEFNSDVKAYAENEPQYPHRVIQRRVLNVG